MKNHHYFLIISLMLLICCTQEGKEAPTEPEKEGKTYTLTGVISEKTKAFISDEGDFSWESGDRVMVLDSATGDLCEFTCKDGDGVFTFTGEPGREYSFTKAWYPASMVSAADVITFPSAWSYDDVSHARNFPMAATVSDGVMPFYHLGGLIKITVKDVPANATSLVLSSPDASICGTFPVTSIGLEDGSVQAKGENVTIENDDIPFTKSVQEVVCATGESAVTISLDPASTQDIATYIPLPCGSYNYKITLLADGTSIFEKGTSSAKVIDRAQLVIMGTLSVSWPSTSLHASYDSQVVDFVPSDIWGWFVARNLPAGKDITIAEGNTEYGTRFATSKHSGYLCECGSGSAYGAFPLKEASDLYISTDKKRLFPLTADAAPAVPSEYEVAHYGLRGNFDGNGYVSKGVFTLSEDLPATNGWRWYVVRNVKCAASTIGFKLYGTPYSPTYGVLETGTSAVQRVGVSRSLARPVSGSTSEVKYSVSPGASYDVYLREDLAYVVMHESGSHGEMDEERFAALSDFGLYNYNGSSWICNSGTDQSWNYGPSFVILDGLTFDQVQFSGMPTSPVEGESSNISITFAPTIGNTSSASVNARVIKINGTKVWLLSDDGTGMIVNAE